MHKLVKVTTETHATLMHKSSGEGVGVTEPILMHKSHRRGSGGNRMTGSRYMPVDDASESVI
jgi:hypothetical protein